MDHSVCSAGSLHHRIDRILATRLITSENQRMDKKAKKRLNVINKKLQTLRPRLSGSREQADDAEELQALENEVTSLEEEAAKLKAS